MTFALRIDIDTRKGLREGVPKLLDVLRRQGVQAAFYVVLGGESGMGELLSHRKAFGAGAGKSGAWNSPLPLHERIRSALVPRNFAEENVEILHRIRDEGHSLGAHGFKHRRWTRSLESLDVREEFRLMDGEFRKLFGEPFTSFCAPGFRTDARVLSALDEFRVPFASDLEGARPFHPMMGGRKFSHVQVPITLKAPSTAPLIEHFSRSGLSDSLVVLRVLDSISETNSRGEISTMYLHDFFEGVYKPQVVEQILIGVRRRGIPFTTLDALASNCRAFKPVEPPLRGKEA